MAAVDTDAIWAELIAIDPAWGDIMIDPIWGTIHTELIRIREGEEAAHERIQISPETREIRLLCNTCSTAHRPIHHPIMEGFVVRLTDLREKGFPLRKHNGENIRSKVPLTCDGKKVQNNRDNSLYSPIYAIRNGMAREDITPERYEELKKQGQRWDRARKAHRPAHYKDYPEFYDAPVPAPAPEVPAPAPEVLEAHDELEEDLRTIFSTDSDEEVVA